jgi:hypothetical protein
MAKKTPDTKTTEDNIEYHSYLARRNTIHRLRRQRPDPDSVTFYEMLLEGPRIDDNKPPSGQRTSRQRPKSVAIEDLYNQPRYTDRITESPTRIPYESTLRGGPPFKFPSPEKAKEMTFLEMLQQEPRIDANERPSGRPKSIPIHVPEYAERFTESPTKMPHESTLANRGGPPFQFPSPMKLKDMPDEFTVALDGQPTTFPSPKKVREKHDKKVASEPEFVISPRSEKTEYTTGYFPLSRFLRLNK